MLLTGSESIRDVILFPLLRPEKQSTAEGTETAEGVGPVSRFMFYAKGGTDLQACNKCWVAGRFSCRGASVFVKRET